MRTKLKLSPHNRSKFKNKLATLFATTLVLVGLLHFKLLLPTIGYLTLLLALHLYLLFVYLRGLPLRQWIKQPKQLIPRTLATVLFGYLLTLTKLTGQPQTVIINLIAATLIHAAILAVLSLEFT